MWLILRMSTPTFDREYDKGCRDGVCGKLGNTGPFYPARSRLVCQAQVSAWNMHCATMQGSVSAF